MSNQNDKARRPVPPPPKLKEAVSAPSWSDFVIEGINVRLRHRDGDKHPMVPAIDTEYEFREDLVREIAWAAWPHDGGPPTPCMLVGPKGCGKTSLITEIGGRCNIPVYRVNLNVGTTVRHLKGQIGAKDHGTHFVDGVVTRAMEEGAWLVLDELSGATPPVALALLPVLEPAGEVLLEDADPVRYVKRHPDFRVFATDNTIGAVQEATRFNYQGTNPDMNEALLDRFGSTVQVGYLSREAEYRIILRYLDKGDTLIHAAQGLCRVAFNIRQSDIQVAFSTRMIIDWARRVAAGAIDAKGAPIPAANVHQLVYDSAFPAFLNKVRSVGERDAIAENILRLFEKARKK